jgi:hypothetical protein
VDAGSAAWLRIAFAATLPFFFWSFGLSGPQSAPAAIVWVYEHVILSFGYWLAVVALSALLALGWRPRLVALLLVLLLLPLDFLSRGRQSRQVLLCALLAFSFVRSDALRMPWRAADVTTKSAGPSWPVRLIQLQLAILYGANAIAKSSLAYLRGDVLMGMSIALPNFKLDLSQGVLDLGLVAIPVALAAVASTVMEYFLAVGFWVWRWRWLVAVLGVAFHIALTFVMQIFKLDLASIFLYLAFLLPLVPRARRRDTNAKSIK